ncbi:hypothetical protein [Ruegeria sp. ANG-R]|uniref:hypothetical protein n=1 Tax=Ruegeria sp. ANG-R TaxID=1577903 RepID=UPI0012698D3B|nr:hypothetical protein [Ruegeria sp. ANG-R]
MADALGAGNAAALDAFCFGDCVTLAIAEILGSAKSLIAIGVGGHKAPNLLIIRDAVTVIVAYEFAKQHRRFLYS